MLPYIAFDTLDAGTRTPLRVMFSRIRRLERSQAVNCDLGAVFDFFARPENLQAITPGWLDFRILEAPGRLRRGSIIRYSLRWRGIPLRWTTEISQWNPPYGFVDTQVAGPYTLWRHSHRFEALGEGTRIHDEVLYELPFGPLGLLVHSAWVRSDLQAIFDFRQQKVDSIFSG